MKILALETNPERICSRYTTDDERQLLLTRYHPIIFWLRLIGTLVIFGIVLALFFWADTQSLIPEVMGIALLLIILIIAAYNVLQSFISYYYNFILVTTEKVVCIYHKAFWKQEVNPTHVDNIISTQQESQFLGIINCGVVKLNLRERTDYSTKIIKLRYVPRYNKVAGEIENAIALYKQHANE